MTFKTFVTNDVTLVTDVATVFTNKSTIGYFWVRTFRWFDTKFCIFITLGRFTATTAN